MKMLHKEDLFCWSEFNEDRNIDFHSYLWVRDKGNIVFDPLPISDHDLNHLTSLGKVSCIIISNSDHVRDAARLAEATGAEVWGPAGEKDNFPIQCSKWLSGGEKDIDGLDIFSLSGSKTEGELAFVINAETLVTGDLIRAHRGGELCMLPNAKLKDVNKARDSVRKLASISSVKSILPGDGWPVFRSGEQVLSELVSSLG